MKSASAGADTPRDAVLTLVANAQESGTRPRWGVQECVAQPMRLTPGNVVPGTRYRITRWLGEGGMGVVFEAQHCDIERKVALKVLREDVRSHPKSAQMFREEARTASTIGSQYIVEIYDFGELDDGRLMFAMELLTGENLGDSSRRDPIAVPRLLGVLRQVCKALAAATKVGVVHHDIKPENVMLVESEGRHDCVKLVDFGVARIMRGGLGSAAGALGTPLYMAPEIWNEGSCDGRVDMYALGCVAHELLVGEPTFLADTVSAVAMRHLSDHPAAPSQLCPDREIPQALDAVVLRCLAKDPADRYGSFEDLEAALCEAQIAAGIETPWDDLPLPSVEPARRDFLLRNMPSADFAPSLPTWRTRVSLALLVVLLCVLAVVLLRPTEHPGPSRIDALTQAARHAGSRAYWVYPAVGDATNTTAFVKVQAIEAMDGAAEDAAELRGALLRQEFSATLTRLGDAYWEREGGRVFATDYYIQALVFEPQNARARARSGATPGEVLFLRRRAARGDFSEQERLALEPLAILAAPDGTAAIARLRDYYLHDGAGSLSRDERMGTFLRGAGAAVPVRVPAVAKPSAEAAASADPTSSIDSTAAADPSRSASARPGATTKNTDRSDRKAAYDLSSKGTSALRRGRRSTAETLFNQALARDSRQAAALIGLSNIAFERGRYTRSLGYAERAVKVSPRRASFRIKLGDAYFKVLRYRDAKRQYEHAARLGHRDAASRQQKVRRKLGL